MSARVESLLHQVLTELRIHTVLQERIVANQLALIEGLASEDAADEPVPMAAYLDGKQCP